MSPADSSTEHTNQRATDQQLFAILRRAKEEDGIPALVTSQINEIGDYDYSGTGLNERLMSLHEDGILGHQKAANRHFWWLSGEGTTEPTELSSLEEMVDYNELDPEKFTEEKAREIAEVAIPGFKKNWWQRVYLGADDLLRPGGGIFLATLGFLAIDSTLIPDPILAFALIFGLGFITVAFVEYTVGYIGAFFARHTGLTEEPWGGKNLSSIVVTRFWRLLKDE